MRFSIIRNFLLSFLAILAFDVQNIFAQSESKIPLKQNSVKKEYRALTASSLRVTKHLFYEGRLEDALYLLDANIRIIQHHDLSMDEQLAELLINRGKYSAFQSFTTNSGYEDALSALETARKIADSLDNKHLLADALLFTGFTLYSRKYNTDKGDYDTPLNHFQQSLQLRQEIEDLKGVSEALIYIGIIHERQDDEETALSYYQKALEISDKNDYKLEKSYATRHIAFIIAARNDLEGALTHFKKSLALREEIGFKIYLPFSYLSVGQIYSEMGNFSDAQTYYEKAYALAKRLNAERVQVLCLLSMGETYLKNKDTDAAAQSYQQAKTISESINYERGIERANEGISKTKR